MFEIGRVGAAIAGTLGVVFLLVAAFEFGALVCVMFGL